MCYLIVSIGIESALQHVPWMSICASPWLYYIANVGKYIGRVVGFYVSVAGLSLEFSLRAPPSGGFWEKMVGMEGKMSDLTTTVDDK